MFVDQTLDPRASAGLGGRFYGVHPAIVVDLNDPDGQGRVRIRLPWSPDSGGEGFEAWARMAAFMGGADRGAWFLPDVDDEVLVAFQAGDPRRPFVLAGLWNGRDAPPESMDGGSENNLKVLKSRSGVTITLDDTGGSETFRVETPGGHTLEMTDGGATVELSDSNGNSLKMEPSGVTITGAAKVTVEAGTVEVNAGSVTVNAGMSTFSGVVQCQTMIATSVIGTTYTPGAGNIW